MGAVLLIGLSGPGAPVATAAEPARPNIVVVYLDDVAPHDGRLWSNPQLTPTLYERFVAGGAHFPNAIVENPICCPARGNLLTGLHTHNNGLDSNHARKFNPSVHIGSALGGAGYSTMFLGKYMNRVHKFTAAEWNAHANGWTHFDVQKGSNGAFYNYHMFTKQGDLAFTTQHSTQTVVDRFRLRSRATPAEQPLFAILSIYNLHAPNAPMPEFAGDPRCTTMPPWNPPNYNEADMSDKPAFQRTRPLLRHANGWPMVRYCEEMLGVDWAVAQVVDELAAQGRLDDTLLIFTADNGMGWGAHRVGQNKRQPFTTPVPLYMSWPARWGLEPRTITEHTTNIDLAPTFCELGGCMLGPFPGGQSGPDGLSLVPLLDGATSLGRDVILEAHPDPFVTPNWHGLRTTASHPAGLWHYVEWSNGARELYDLAADPWELENLAGQQSSAMLMTVLSGQLRQLRQAGRAETPAAVGPSVPQGLSAVAEPGLVIQLSWQPSTTAAGGTVRYRVFRNGRAIGTLQTATTYTDQRGRVRTFSYQVRAIDAAGRKSALSPPVTITSQR
jgi:N-acetylglucosamine-6-sulfatase